MPASHLRSARSGPLAAAGVVAVSWLAFVLQPETAALETSGPASLLDYFVYYRPNAQRGFAALREGSIPFWDACRGLGGPLLATAQTGLLYPPNWLHLLLPTQQSFAVLAVLHLALGSYFVALLARALGAGGIGAALSGLCFGLSPYFCSAVWTPPILYSAAWVPAILLAIDAAIRRPSGAAVAGLACAVGLQALAGWPFVMLLTAALAAVFGLAAVLERTIGTGSLPLRGMLVVAVGGLVGIALAAPQLVPTFELASESPRAPGLLTTTQAIFLSEPHRPIVLWESLRSRGVSDGIPGIGSLALAVLAILLPGPARLRIAGLLLAGAFALLVSFADNTPVYGWIRKLPLFSDFRFPMRYRLLSTLAISICAGVGVGRVLELAGRNGSRRSWLVAVGCAAAIGAQGVAVLAAQLPYAWRSSLVPPDPALQTLERAIGREPAPTRAVLDGHSSRKPGDRCVPLVNDLEPLSLGTTASAMQFFERGTTESAGAPYYGLIQLPVDGARAALLGVLAVPLVASERAPQWLESSGVPRARYLGKPFVFFDPDAVPRAYRVTRSEQQPARADEALSRLVADDFDPRTTVLLDAPAGLPDAAAGSGGEVVIEAYEPDRVVLETRGDGAGIVVLVDAFFPGWTATLDGREVPILRANYVGRAVAVPAGEHRIEMRYRPSGWTASCIVASVGATVVGISAASSIMAGRRRRAGCPRD